MPQHVLSLRLCIFFSVCTAIGCKPLIHSFTVTPLTITARDSVRMKWSVRGSPTLLTHTDSTEQPGFESREFTLVVEKNGKQVKNTAVVNVLPEQSADIIEFDCVRKGDTLIAKGEKNIRRWGNHFLLGTVRSYSGRALLVVHAGHSASLLADSSGSAALAGLPNSGTWTIKTMLTAAEKKDSSSIPGTLQLQTILVFNK